MYSILVVVNKHNTARVGSCWFIIYYRLVMQGDSNIKFIDKVNSFQRVDVVSCILISIKPSEFLRRSTRH